MVKLHLQGKGVDKVLFITKERDYYQGMDFVQIADMEAFSQLPFKLYFTAGGFLVLDFDSEYLSDTEIRISQNGRFLKSASLKDIVS